MKKKPAVTSQSPRRTQEQRRTATRQKLIDAAITLIHESGFSRMTLHDVAGRAGLTTGAVQHHFASGQELLRAVVEAVYPVFQLPIDEVVAEKMPLQRRLHRLIDLYWGLYRSPEYLVFWELLFGTREHPEFRKTLSLMREEMADAAVAGLMRAFSDVRLQKKAAFELWTFLASQLRGLALLAIFESERVVAADIRLLKDAAWHLFRQRIMRNSPA